LIPKVIPIPHDKDRTMDLRIDQAQLSLPRRGLLRLPDAAGVQIACRSGALWITLDDDPRDFVIEAGERFSTDEHRTAIVYALRPSQFGLYQGEAAHAAAAVTALGTVGRATPALAAA
jgi:hypothetical protein